MDLLVFLGAVLLWTNCGVTLGPRLVLEGYLQVVSIACPEKGHCCSYLSCVLSCHRFAAEAKKKNACWVCCGLFFMFRGVCRVIGGSLQVHARTVVWSVYRFLSLSSLTSFLFGIFVPYLLWFTFWWSWSFMICLFFFCDVCGYSRSSCDVYLLMVLTCKPSLFIHLFIYYYVLLIAISSRPFVMLLGLLIP